jgi:hypothetical protein
MMVSVKLHDTLRLSGMARNMFTKSVKGVAMDRAASGVPA